MLHTKYQTNSSHNELNEWLPSLLSPVLSSLMEELMNGEMAPGCAAQGSPMRFLLNREFFNWKSEGCLSNEVDIVPLNKHWQKKRKKDTGQKTHPFLQNTKKAQLELPHNLCCSLYSLLAQKPTQVSELYRCGSSPPCLHWLRWVTLPLETVPHLYLQSPLIPGGWGGGLCQWEGQGGIPRKL